jgi:hypothetical protein
MGAAVEWVDGGLVVWGGSDLSREFMSGAIYSPSATAGPSWQTMPRPEEGGGIVTASGWTGRLFFASAKSVVAFDPTDRAWTTAVPPLPIAPFAAVWTGTEVIVVGGSPRDAPASTVALAYGADGSCCRLLPPPPVSIDHGVAVWNGAEVILIGGRSDRDEVAVLATYDPESNRWEARGDTPLGGARGLTAVWSAGSVVAIDSELVGGRWNQESGWRAMKPPPFDAPGCFTRLTAVGNDVFAWHCRQAAVYDPASGRWAAIATPELPSHAISTSCVPRAAGRTVYLWCGNGDGARPLFYSVDLASVEPPPTP